MTKAHNACPTILFRTWTVCTTHLTTQWSSAGSIQARNRALNVGTMHTDRMYVDVVSLYKHFYRCVHAAGLTARLYTPQEDHLFPHATPYRLGLTNLAHRPTARSEQLTRAELEQGVVPLLRKICEYYPRIVCFVGKHIAEVVLRIVRKTYTLTSHTWNGPPDLLCADSAMCTEPTTSAVSQRDRGYGLLPLCIRHAHGYTYLFVTPSTSARVTHHQLDGKSRIMSYLVPILSSLGENSTSNTTSTPYVIPCLDISTSSLRT